MAKAQLISKARKEHKCNKCGQIIPKGSSYYRGEINFGPTIIRCQKCGLESWEVTTSDYQLRAGQITYRWEEDYGCSEDTIDIISSELNDFISELQDRLDNMPEGLQEGDVGQLLQERIDGLELAQSDIDSIDIDDIKQQSAEDVAGELSLSEYAGDSDCVTWDMLMDRNDEDVRGHLESSFEDGLRDAIQEALDSIEV